MRRAPLLLVLAAACHGPATSNCFAVAPSVKLYENYCPDAPQGVCFSSTDTGF